MMKRLSLLLFVAISGVFTLPLHAQLLVESFRNMDCAPCKTNDIPFEAYLKAHPEFKVNLVYIHNNIGDTHDPFYLATQTDALYRQNIYKVSSDPSVFVSGYKTDPNVDAWKQYTSAAFTNVHYGTTVTVGASADKSDKIHITMHVEGSSSGKQVKPYIMLVESGISYHNNDVNYGNPENDIWDNVFRGMIPAKDGDVATVITGAKDYAYDYDVSGKGFNLANCKVIAFLQEVTTQTDAVSRNIIGMSSSAVATAGVEDAVAEESRLGLPLSNPAVRSVTIPFQISHPSTVRIVAIDILGNEVELLNEFVSNTKSHITFTPRSQVATMYTLRMYANGKAVGTQKVAFVQ
ncbi:MAG: Omp28-related outer membrane protein [bacterium]